MLRLLVLAGIILALALVIHAESTAPDPHAACEDLATQTERDQCRHTVDFALSAGM